MRGCRFSRGSSGRACSTGCGAELPHRLCRLPHPLQVIVLAIAKSLFIGHGDHLSIC